MQQAVAERTHQFYSEHFQARRKERMSEPVWLLERRTAAMAAFEAQGFPTRKHEAWRNLDLTPVAKGEFASVRLAGEVDALAEAVKQIMPDAHRLVFVDGHFSAAHSSLGELPDGVTLQPLSAAIADDDPLLTEHLARQAVPEKHVFAALNTALFEDGALIKVGRNIVLEQPVLIAYLASAEAKERAVYPRTLVVAEEGAEIKIAELHQGGEGVYLNCPVTEIVAAANAGVHYHVVQESGAEAYHFGVVAGQTVADSRLSIHSFALGGKVARMDIYGDLAAAGAQLEMDGLYLVDDGQYIDYHTWVRHLSAHCQSRQLFKGVLRGRSESVFDGLVHVAEGAQQTDAQQENHNLLLTRRALTHSNPRLEIYNDDVKCTHGSTLGELDPEALFYLRSRGIGMEAAQGLLTYAFVGEVLAQVRIDALREYQQGLARRYLPSDQAVKEVV